ncbi:transposase [Thiohalocapsa sp. ML1]|uniref:transposase n=1 Tax=Thiohalocapsa sp. ML1 TaxID=1431688 RepID=UPI00138F1118
MSFIHRFGASLNRHVHDHCCVIDGGFDVLDCSEPVGPGQRGEGRRATRCGTVENSGLPSADSAL